MNMSTYFCIKHCV